MNSYTAVRAEGQKPKGSITTIGADSMMGALARITHELGKPGRLHYLNSWIGQGCPVIENRDDSQVFYLCIGEEN